MKYIEKMLSGEMEMVDFIYFLKNDPQLKIDLDTMIPDDARERSHPLWKSVGYSALVKYDFKIYDYIINTCELDNSLGDNLNIFGMISRIYLIFHPNFVCTNLYDDSYDLYLSVAGEAYGGPEVDQLIDKTIKECLSIEKKGQREKEARRRMKELFHTTDTRPPYWIQGAEWPMGQNSPMRFVEKKRRGEQVEYIFEDVDTLQKRVIVQYY